MDVPSSTPLRIALIGAGRVGTAVASLAQRAGNEIVGVASRSARSAAAAAERLGAATFDVSGELPRADVYLLGATDAGIATLAEALAGRLVPETYLVHFSGVLDTRVLEPALAPGIEGLALHPVAACPDVDTALRRLPGAAWGVTCSAEAEGWARGFVTLLGGRPVVVAGPARPLWHAASVITSNGLSALLAVGEELLSQAGIGEPGDVLGPLAAGTLANAAEAGGGAASLTGPFVRGEVATVARHLEALGPHPEAEAAYRRAGTMIVTVARSEGRLSWEVADRLLGMLGP